MVLYIGNAYSGLRSVRRLLDYPDRWTKNAFARSNGKALESTNLVYADCFCLLGAIIDCIEDLATRDLAIALLVKELPHWANDSIASFNDHYTTKHNHVLDLLDRTIARQFQKLGIQNG